MGYGIRISGQLVFSEPLPWESVKDSKYAKREGDLELILSQVPSGTSIVTQAVGLEDPIGESFSRYHLEEDLQAFVDAHPGIEFNGRLDLEGEEAGDLRRVKVIDGSVVTFEPKLVWPAESE